MSKSIIIVGAGIIGVTLAWKLSRNKNLKITLIETNDLVSGASQHSFAWLNACLTFSEHYMQFRMNALQHWQQLDQDTKQQLNIDWCGSLTWLKDTSLTHQFIVQQRQLGFHLAELSEKHISQLEPNLKKLPELAAFAKDEGAINLPFVLKSLLKEAIENGITYLPYHPVISLIEQQNSIVGVRCINANFYADQIILTSGLGHQVLLDQFNLNLGIESSPSILLKMTYQGNLKPIQHILSTPEMEVRINQSGEMLAAEDYIDDLDENSPKLIAEHTIQAIKSNLKDPYELQLKQVSTGYRPIPKDGLPIIGSVHNLSGLYLINSHTAVTLAPLLSELAYQEIVFGLSQPILTPYRPHRCIQFK